MKRAIATCILLIICNFTKAQNFSNLSFGTDSTLEIMTWNIENFPKKNATANYVKQIIQALDIDVIAFQEIKDTVAFRNMINSIGGYKYKLGHYYYTCLGFAYKTSTIHNTHIYEIYNSNAYSSTFPRSPLVINFTFNDQELFLINNHLKCCGDGILNMNNNNDEEYRRYKAMNLLRDYIEEHFVDTKVVVVGDMNDELTDDTNNNVFSSIIADSQNYMFTDMAIAQGSSSNWSYPSWPSHLDHILITNELFDDFEREGSAIQVIKADSHMSSWNAYDNNISDHRPVGLKLNFNAVINGQPNNMIATTLSIYPNPANNIINFEFNSNCDIVLVHNSLGQLVSSIEVTNGNTNAQLSTIQLANGMYFASVLKGNTVVSRAKFVVKH